MIGGSYIMCSQRTSKRLRTMQHLLFLASALLLILIADSGLTLASSATGSAFDPLAFRQYWKEAKCPGINRAENTTVDLKLRMFPQPHPIRIVYRRSTLNLVLAFGRIC